MAACWQVAKAYFEEVDYPAAARVFEQARIKDPCRVEVRRKRLPPCTASLFLGVLKLVLAPSALLSEAFIPSGLHTRTWRYFPPFCGT